MTRCLTAAAVTGLQVDVDRIREDNARRSDVERKAGLIIWSGGMYHARSCSFSKPAVPDVH